MTDPERDPGLSFNQREKGYVMSLLNKIFSIIDWLSEWAGKICIPLIVVLSFVVLYEIVMRSFFKPTMWTYETTQFIFVICSLLPAGLLLKNNEHIEVDIVTSRLTTKTRVILKIITFPVFLLYIGALVYFGYSISFESLHILERTGSVWDPYIFPIKFMVPIGATLLLLQGIANLVRDIERTFFTKADPLMQAEKPQDLGSY